MVIYILRLYGCFKIFPHIFPTQLKNFWSYWRIFQIIPHPTSHPKECVVNACKHKFACTKVTPKQRNRAHFITHAPYCAWVIKSPQWKRYISNSWDQIWICVSLYCENNIKHITYLHVHDTTEKKPFDELRSFHLMLCLPRVVLRRPRVILPGVWSCFDRTLSPHLHLCLWAPFLERGIHVFTLFRLFICVRLIIRLMRKKSWTCLDSLYS